MCGNYEIYLGQDAIGQVQVSREGLYYRFDAYCNLSGDVMYNVVAECGGIGHNLGITVPQGGKFVLNTRMAVKNFEEGEFCFYVIPRHLTSKELFVAISPEEPFSYLSKLRSAYMDRRNGQIGIVLKQKEV